MVRHAAAAARRGRASSRQIRGHQHPVGTGHRVEQVAVRALATRIADPCPTSTVPARAAPSAAGQRPARQPWPRSGPTEDRRACGRTSTVEVHVRVHNPGSSPAVEIDDLRAIGRGQVRASRRRRRCRQEVGHRAVERAIAAGSRVGHRFFRWGAWASDLDWSRSHCGYGRVGRHHRRSPHLGWSPFSASLLARAGRLRSVAVVTMANGRASIHGVVRGRPRALRVPRRRRRVRRDGQRRKERGPPTWAGPWHRQEGESHNDGGRGLTSTRRRGRTWRLHSAVWVGRLMSTVGRPARGRGLLPRRLDGPSRLPTLGAGYEPLESAADPLEPPSIPSVRPSTTRAAFTPPRVPDPPRATLTRPRRPCPPEASSLGRGVALLALEMLIRRGVPYAAHSSGSVEPAGVEVGAPWRSLSRSVCRR